MRFMRHGVITDYDPGPFVSISTLAWEYPSRYLVPEHAHGSGQLIYATRGVMEVSAGQSFWLVPPQFGVWIPPRAMHSIRMPGPVSMRTLYLKRSLAESMPPSCAVLHVRPLMRELIIEIVRMRSLSVRKPLHCALRDVILTEMSQASTVPARLELPRDSRAAAVARLCLADPASKRSLADMCAESGLSVRTLERLFQRDAGIAFEMWRRQARVMKAIELLLTGCSVKETAARVGYERPGTLIDVFRKTTGLTPRAWLRGLGNQLGEGDSACSTTRNRTGP